MKYLHCDNCGHPNPLTSEYLTFCDTCGKKLPHSFTSWQKQHPMATFPEYCHSVGVSLKEKTNTGPLYWIKHQLQTANKGKIILFFSLVFILVAVTGSLFGKRAMFTFLYPKVSPSSLYSTWHTATIGRQALEISTPVKLWVHDQPLEEEDAKVIEYAKTYSNEDGGGIRIAVNMFSYISNVANSLEEAVAASHKSMQLKETATEMDCKSVPVLISGMQGVLEEGNYLYKGGIRLAFCNLVMIKGSNRWQIQINYREDDPVGRQVAQRVLKSVKIK
ncbi:zinc ribbon domain-containing protein [Chitinophaga sp. OAE865]|uniref:zinc ribbon domain-containing protein n=1 Tax=Chitinophaga sp. OAE865 TaxID=2817898 RepID=UPI001AE5BD2D